MYKYRKIFVILLSFIMLLNILMPYVATEIRSETANVSLTFSKPSFSLTYGGSSATNTITVLGMGCTNVISSHSTKGIVAGTWSKWSGNSISYTLIPLAVGTTTITITPVDTDGLPINYSSKTFSVTVSKSKPNLSFQYYKITKTCGDVTFTNILSKATDGAVTYTSSDTSVATVGKSTGAVNIVRAGVCTIKADSEIGNNYLAGSASYSLTVNKANPMLVFSSSAVYKLYGDVPFINSLVNTSDGTLTFTTSNNKVATVNSSTGMVTIVGDGNCTITANTTAGINYTAANKSYLLRISPKDSLTPNSGKSPTATPVTLIYTIVFNSNGGSSVKSQVVVAGNAVNVPAPPKKNGYFFDGWYNDKGEKWEFKNVIKSNMTLTARWKVKEVTLKANYSKGRISGKTISKALVKLVYDKKILKTTNADPKGNFSFKNLNKYKHKKIELVASKMEYKSKTMIFDYRRKLTFKAANFYGIDLKGRTTPKATVTLLYNKKIIRRVKADSKGYFIMKKLKLDQYLGKELRLQASKKDYKMCERKFTLAKK